MAGDHDTQGIAQVIVVGAGPVGLMLASELCLGGADVIVLEQRSSPTTESRASTLHARTMEILDSRGLLGPLGDVPNETRGHFGGLPLDLTLPSGHPGQWKVPQTHTERLLEDWAYALGADVRRGWRVRELAEDDTGVTVTAQTPDGVVRLRSGFVVGCDGEDSVVRGLAGTEFPGRSATRELLRADVSGIDIRNRRFERLEYGLAIAARNNAGVTRVMVHEFGARARAGAPDFTDVVHTWKRVTGEDISGGTPLWVNSFGDANRQVTRYRTGRVLLAGDAAHHQMPIGGQALNLGLQDAVNLGWKLALHVRQNGEPDGLLDTYHAERHAVGARVLANIGAQALLLLGDAEVEPARQVLGELIATEDNRVHLAGMISGLDIRYEVGGGAHPLLGMRLPDTQVVLPRLTTTTALLRSGRGLLLDCGGEHGTLVARLAAGWADRVVPATVVPALGDPLHGAGVVLVRPDGHVAATCSGHAEAASALRCWFGPTRSDL